MSISIFHIFFILSLPFTFYLLTDAVDRISINQSLSGNQTVVSQGGMYELGLFKPNNSSSYYIGIWQNKISQPKVVWVANRDTPLSSNSFEVKISQDGNLVLLSHSKIAVWSTNSTSLMPNSTVAVLLDTGNLVLRDGSNASAVFWQSFDHPTDTWLPGGKIGMNKFTGEPIKLISWRNSDDPSLGIYSIQTNGTNTFYMLWNESKKYWSSGAWDGRTFSLLPESTSLVNSQVSQRINFSLITNDKESYFTFMVVDPSLLWRILLDSSTGKLGVWVWTKSSQNWLLIWSAPTDQCDVYSVCGAFGSCNGKGTTFCTCLQGFEPKSLEEWDLGDRSGGCVRKSTLNCGRNGSKAREKDGFLKIPGMRFPENKQSLTAGSAKECELACFNNCSCTAYAYTSGCLLWVGDLLNVRQLSDGDPNPGGDLYLRLAASDLPKSKDNRRRVIAEILGAGAGAVLLLAVTLLLVMRARRKRSYKASKEVHGSLVAFSYGDLQSATKNFSQKLGQGSFGSVFKGNLPNSAVIAVKKLEGVRQGEKEFRMEVNTIGVIQHVNLVRLHGFCSEGSRRLLVYEYMPNGSLDSHLFQSESDLNWKKRYQIALGAARGLAYLHEKCRDCIIHCDIKPENILLDANFCPKVADFGMAKLLGREFSKVLTTMRGTIGYLAPEWISGLPITTKADVYSYGMMLLEIISGTRNSNKTYNGNVVFFPVWAAIKVSEGDVESILDSQLHGDADMEELSRACRAACWCIQDEETSRPSMGRVVQILEGVLEVETPPVPSLLKRLAENQ